MTTLTTRPLPTMTRDVEVLKRDMDDFGYAIVEDALSQEQVSALVARFMDQAKGEAEANGRRARRRQRHVDRPGVPGAEQGRRVAGDDRPDRHGPPGAGARLRRLLPPDARPVLPRPEVPAVVDGREVQAPGHVPDGAGLPHRPEVGQRPPRLPDRVHGLLLLERLHPRERGDARRARQSQAAVADVGAVPRRGARDDRAGRHDRGPRRNRVPLRGPDVARRGHQHLRRHPDPPQRLPLRAVPPAA